MYLWVILLVLPVCRAQFSIQGPSDGHRQAAGLKVSQEKGVEYIPHKDIINAGGFTIQGATDGNSQIQGASDGRNDFAIQGATDSNANFQIQGATDSNANFHIQGATDANANFQIQGPSTGGSNTYVQGNYQQPEPAPQPAPRPVHRGGGRALQYKDPSGLRVNWKSYNQRAQAQAPASQYVAEQPARPVQQHRRPAAQPQYQQAQPQQQPQYTHHVPVQPRPLDNAPERIKQLLAFQQQIPYVNSIPEQYRYDGLPNAIAQAEQFRQEYPKQVIQQLEANRHQQPQQQQPQEQLEAEPAQRYRVKQRGPARAKRQAEKHGQPQYRRIAAPAQEQLPQYSTNLPGDIQQLLKFQASIPYDIIANRITYKLDKPYVPQPVQQPQPQYQQPQPQPQYQQPQPQPQYQPQPQPQYQPQPQPQYQQPQPQPQYQQPQPQPQPQPQYQQLRQYQKAQPQRGRLLAQSAADNSQFQSPLLTLNQQQSAAPSYRPRLGPYTNNPAYAQQSQIRPVTE